jgi:hypothetical protein
VPPPTCSRLRPTAHSTRVRNAPLSQIGGTPWQERQGTETGSGGGSRRRRRTRSRPGCGRRTRRRWRHPSGRGCVESGKPVKHRPLTYEHPKATARILPGRELKSLMRDPLLRSADSARTPVRRSASGTARCSAEARIRLLLRQAQSIQLPSSAVTTIGLCARALAPARRRCACGVRKDGGLVTAAVRTPSARAGSDRPLADTRKPRKAGGLAGQRIWTKCNQAEAEGLEPPRACARRISSAVPYQLGLRLQGGRTGHDARSDRTFKFTGFSAAPQPREAVSGRRHSLDR